jgi:guanylate kinase
MVNRRSQMSREGLLVIVCGPSGVGKGTILSALKERNGNIRYSISATTRSPRQGEEDGVNYFFKTREEFEEMIKNDELIEWDEYCGNFYGTPRSYVEQTIKQGYDVILEITVEGALNIKKKYPDCVSIFLLPPSFAELRRRIVGRGTESDEIITKRLEAARKEIEQVDKYDYVVINDYVEKTADSLNYILHSEKLKYTRNTDILQRIGMKD